ncbi:MAG: cation transporter [Calditerrivibrio nitroreducens]|uniref:Cation transporter n=1 Tax=Calditerrivibrio nitroreducens TaxID=477976 RepID=A0A2J6WIE5_9BACT|nr:MAG: cation transporter [Calditerrivibrio nitroreducens]
MIKKTKIPIFSITMAAILALSKLIVALYTWSMAILSSALDSILDIVASGVNYFALKASEEPPDKAHPYGHGKFESLAAFVQALIIMATGVYLFYRSIMGLIDKKDLTDLNTGIYIMLFSMFMTLLLAISLRYYAKKYNSTIILTDAMHYEIDLITNTGVLVTLFLVRYTGFYQIDFIVSSLISVYIIYSAFDLARDVSSILLDREMSEEDQTKIRDILKDYDNSFVDYHKMRTRSSGKTKFVDMHITLCKNMSLNDAHHIADFIEKDLKEKISDLDVIIHIDPCEIGNCPGQENCERFIDVIKTKKIDN